MTTKELMVGDYITFSDVQNDSDCPKLKVVTIDKEDVYVLIDGDPVVDVLDPKDLAGIPLTPEILEKNGFKEISCGTSYVYGLTDDYYAVAIDELSDSIWRVEYFNREFNLPLCRNTVLFVHELQHALRLYGVEKNIEL